MKKILPIHYPLIQHKPADAILLSIIGDKKDEYSWIMNNFVNLRYNPKTKYDDFFRNDMWYNCYHITESRFTKEFIDLFSTNPFDLIKRMIDAEYYIYIFLNRRFISNYNQSDEDFWHNSLIYGYDEEQNIIYIADFFRGKRFDFETCSIDEFCHAYSYPEGDEEFYFYVWNRAIKKKEGYQYRFNIDDLILKLEDYIKCTDLNSSHYYTFDTNDVEEVEYMHIEGGYDYVYGIDVYDAICEDLQNNELSIRPLHLLYEHKVLMCRRIAYLKEKGYLDTDTGLDDECMHLQNEILIIRTLFLKYRMSNKLNEQNNLELCRRLKKLKTKEEKFVINLVRILREYRMVSNDDKI